MTRAPIAALSIAAVLGGCGTVHETVLRDVVATTETWQPTAVPSEATIDHDQLFVDTRQGPRRYERASIARKDDLLLVMAEDRSEAIPMGDVIEVRGRTTVAHEERLESGGAGDAAWGVCIAGLVLSGLLLVAVASED